jgi:hypothetical protein
MNSRERLSPTDRPHIAASDPYLDYGPPLPERYGILTLRALVRDPRSVFAFWEWPEAEKKAAWAVRLRDVATSAATIAMLDRAAAACGSFYFEAAPERDYEVDLGWTSGEVFVVVRTSNRIRTPREGPATEIDPDWAPAEGEADVWRSLSGPKARAWTRGGAYGRGGPSHG